MVGVSIHEELTVFGKIAAFGRLRNTGLKFLQKAQPAGDQSFNT